MNSQNFLSLKIEDKFSKLKGKMEEFIKAHPNVFYLSILAIACLIFLFCGLGYYPLIDVDETRYAVMARDLIHSGDWNSLMLNGVPFLEKPPLYFWLVALSIKLFNGFSQWSVRFPIAMLSSFLVFFTYFLGERIISRKFGLISALTLLSSIFFLILAHTAILDMVLTVFITSALYCALLTHFCEEKNKKYYWWYFYLFISLGFLSKGILGLAIPLVIALTYNLITKTLKDFFKPIYIIPGMIIFFVSILPWHLLMYQIYGYEFIKQYFLLHHFARFMGSEIIGREKPFLYFVPVFLVGFMPWTILFIAFLTDGLKKLSAKYKSVQGNFKDKFLGLIEVNTNEQKLLLFAIINFIIIFLVFSTSSTKLPTYILPIFPSAALLTGYFWWISDEKNENEKMIYNSTLALCTIFTISAFVSSFGYYFLPYDFQYRLAGFYQQAIIGLYLLSIFLVLRLNTKKALSIFSGYLFLMVFVIALAVTQIFNVIYKGGENELVAFADISSQYANSQLITFDFAVKPSVMLDYKHRIIFITGPEFDKLDKALADKEHRFKRHKFKNHKFRKYRLIKGKSFVIVKNENFEYNDSYEKQIEKRLKLVQRGEKYSLYSKD